jgi:hypothetical protein
LTAATVTAGAIAGCSGSDGDDNGDPNNNSSDGSNNEPDPGREPLDQGIETLVTVASRLDELTAPGVERTQSDVGDLRGQLDDAEQSLDDAAEVTESLGDQIDAARTVLNFQRSLVDSHEQGIEMRQVLREQSPSEQIPDSPFDSNTEEVPFTEARETVLGGVDPLKTALDVVEQRRTLHDDLETAHDNVNGGAIDTSALAYGGDLSQYVRYDRAALDQLVAYLEGHIAFFEGFAEMLLGGSQFQNEAWSDAVDSFSSAREILDSARFDEIDDDSFVQQLGLTEVGYFDIDGAVSQTTTLRDQAEELVDIAETAQNGNVEEAQTQFEQALSGQ